MVAEINRLRKANESLGGSFECLPSAPSPASAPTSPGKTGSTAASPAPSPRIQSSRASPSAKPGRRRPPRLGGHDEIFWSEERGYYRETNHAGGLEADDHRRAARGRAAIKPISHA